MNRPSVRLGRRPRMVMAMLAVGLMAVLGTARVLRPEPRGFGTHTQLGLGVCAFQELSGKPCPTCGMTTAFAWSVRGRFDKAAQANPAGSLLAPTCLLLIPWLLAVAVSGRSWPFRTVEGPLVSVVLATVALALASWAVRLLWLFR